MLLLYRKEFPGTGTGFRRQHPIYALKRKKLDLAIAEVKGPVSFKTTAETTVSWENIRSRYVLNKQITTINRNMYILFLSKEYGFISGNPIDFYLELHV